MVINLGELNIMHGGRRRVPKILNRIRVYNADIVVLTEYRHNQNSDIIKNKLLDEGYKWQTAAIGNRNQNTIFIASKLHFESVVPIIKLLSGQI